MDTRTLFQKISQRMCADFEASAQIKHSGSKGTVRENSLRKFLEERLPAKYALGAGEVVGRVRDTTSHQCDVIVYDRLNGVTLLYDESIQVFPIDCVYGIIEVKSALSKAEFLDALEKIKVLKAMAPGGAVSQPVGGYTLVHARPRPFGMIFAYSLANNSLNSLVENLREWEEKTPSALWPNYVCILEAGVIYHQGKPFETCHDSDKITAEAWPTYISYGKDSLFQFYCVLHDMCAHMQLGPVELMQYYDPSVQIGKYVVYGKGIEGQLMKNGASEVIPFRLSESAIDKVVGWCSTHGQMRYGDVLQKQFGSIPLGMENSAILNMPVFLYNPDNLPGLHEIGQNPIMMIGNRPTMAPCIANACTWDIDGQRYIVTMQGFTEDDYEDLSNPSTKVANSQT